MCFITCTASLLITFSFIVNNRTNCSCGVILGNSACMSICLLWFMSHWLSQWWTLNHSLFSYLYTLWWLLNPCLSAHIYYYCGINHTHILYTARPHSFHVYLLLSLYNFQHLIHISTISGILIICTSQYHHLLHTIHFPDTVTDKSDQLYRALSASSFVGILYLWSKYIHSSSYC